MRDHQIKPDSISSTSSFQAVLYGCSNTMSLEVMFFMNKELLENNHTQCLSVFLLCSFFKEGRLFSVRKSKSCFNIPNLMSMLVVTVPTMLKWSFMYVMSYLLFTGYECLPPKVNGIFKESVDFSLIQNENLVLKHIFS